MEHGAILRPDKSASFRRQPPPSFRDRSRNITVCDPDVRAGPQHGGNIAKEPVTGKIAFNAARCPQHRGLMVWL
jgi:hypothetical protein